MRRLTFPTAILAPRSSGAGSAAPAVAAATALANTRARVLIGCLLSAVRRRTGGLVASGPLRCRSASALRHVHLVEHGAQARRQPLRVIIRPEMHEEEAG